MAIKGFNTIDKEIKDNKGKIDSKPKKGGKLGLIPGIIKDIYTKLDNINKRLNKIEKP